MQKGLYMLKRKLYVAPYSAPSAGHFQKLYVCTCKEVVVGVTIMNSEILRDKIPGCYTGFNFILVQRVSGSSTQKRFMKSHTISK
jgi:hypothetical protein